MIQPPRKVSSISCQYLKLTPSLWKLCLGVGLKLQVHSWARQGKVPKLGQWEDEREGTKELKPKIPWLSSCFALGQEAVESCRELVWQRTHLVSHICSPEVDLQQPRKLLNSEECPPWTSLGRAHRLFRVSPMWETFGVRLVQDLKVTLCLCFPVWSMGIIVMPSHSTVGRTGCSWGSAKPDAEWVLWEGDFVSCSCKTDAV